SPANTGNYPVSLRPPLKARQPDLRAGSLYTAIGFNKPRRAVVPQQLNGVPPVKSSQPPSEPPRRLLRRNEVLKLLRIKRTALDEAIARGDFPGSIKLFDGGRAVVWDEEEVLNYLERRFAARTRATEIKR